MQFLSLILFTLSAGALPQSHSGKSLEAPALPTITTSANSTIPNSFEKRAEHPWIGSFDNEKCSGRHEGYRPEIPYGSCVNFFPWQQWYSIYWGSFPLNIRYLRVYMGPDCSASWVTIDGHLGKHTCLPSTSFLGSSVKAVLEKDS